MSKILVIDDSELVSKLLKEALSEAGYEVAIAMDANEGYAAALEFQPDLILLDVQLPDIAGFDLLRVIKNREELHHVPIIMITGTHNQTDHKVKAFQAGADDYVLKPFEMPELLERIRAILRRTGPRPEPRSVIAPIAVAPRATSTPTKSPLTQDVSVTQAVTALFLSPLEFPPQAPLPGVALAYVIGSLALVFAGLAATAGTTVKPVLAGCGVLGGWGALVSVLVMSASLLGVTLSWKEGARLISMAGLPMMLKMVGALVTSVWTSLSPFYYTASPALFLKSAPGWLGRLDVFEIWSVLLIWVLLRRRAGSSEKKAWIITGVVWFAGLALAAGLGKLGTGT